jgi:hypothetical protein
MSERLRLPDSRRSEIIDFQHGGRRWTASISRFSDGQVAEIFLDAAKGGTVAQLARESAIVASLALQFGCDISTLRHAISGTAAGPLSISLDLAEGSVP